jgi:hypothetical protein
MADSEEVVDGNQDRPLREFVGFIWIGDQPGIRLSVWAHTGEEARAQVVAEHGEGHVISLRNEDDARKPRVAENPHGSPSIARHADGDTVSGSGLISLVSEFCR